MKIFHLQGRQNVYTSNAYLITGDWNAIGDMNTLVDVGADATIIDQLEEIYTGVGKKRVDQVILTHNHSDHTAILPLIREKYQPKIFAFSEFFAGIDRVVRNGEMIRMGDGMFEIIHMPAHTEDSILLYNRESGILFVGDSPIIVRTPGGAYREEFIQVLKRLSRRNVRQIYCGHGEPLTVNVTEMLRYSLRNASASQVADSLCQPAELCGAEGG